MTDFTFVENYNSCCSVIVHMPAHVAVLTESEDAAEQFVREYVLEAVERAPETEGCEGLAFSLNEPPNPDGGSVGMTILGDESTFVNAEKPTWKKYTQDGLVQEWTVDDLPQEHFERVFGEKGSKLAKRLMPLAERMATVVYDEFESLDELPAPYDTYPDETTPAGWWTVPHHIAYASLDYSAAEEIKMHKAGIEEDLKLIAEFEGEDAVDSQLDALLADLEDMREDVKKGRTRGQQE